MTHAALPRPRRALALWLIAAGLLLGIGLLTLAVRTELQGVPVAALDADGVTATPALLERLYAQRGGARSRAEVHAFHTVALATGGRDNGAPGLRPHYHPDYYAAFVLDPDGMNIEAVCHKPE